MKIISRDAAIAEGMRRYFTGLPCVNGHIDERLVSRNNECVACKSIRDRSYGERHKAEKAAYDTSYREANAERVKANKARWLAENREKQRVYMLAYYAGRRDAMRAYRLSNRDKRNAQKRAWDAANREAVREYRRVYQPARMAENLNYKIGVQLRVRLAVAVRSRSKGGSAVAALGCSMEEFRRHLEARFVGGMSWENWGRKGWHIDHIRPLASFDLTLAEHVAAACHFSNLQPLWYQDNLSKGARM